MVMIFHLIRTQMPTRPKQDIAKAKCHPLSASRRPVARTTYIVVIERR